MNMLSALRWRVSVHAVFVSWGMPYACILVVGLMLVLSPALAHEGHDHGEPEPDPATFVLAPRAEAAGDLAELLLVADGGGLVLHVDRFTTNQPLAGAVVELESGGQTWKATTGLDGVARVVAPGLLKPGAHPLIVTVSWQGQADLLETTLRVSPAAGQVSTPPAPHTHGWSTRRWAGLAGVALLAVGLIGLTLALRARGRQGAGARGTDATALQGLAAAAALGCGVMGAWPPEVFAAPATGVAAAAPAAAVPYGAERAQRLPDGSVFLSKLAQHRLGVRTAVAREATLPRTVELAAEVIADPRRSGRVQAPQAGQLQPPPGGLPLPGQRVVAGQVLALLVPLATSGEAANLAADRAELAVKLAQTEREVARARTLEATLPRRTIEALESEAQALRKRRDALGLAAQSVPLRAPVDGVLLAPTGAPLPAAGQVVEARETLFDVVNPSALLVQARVADRATALAIEGASLADGPAAGTPLVVAGRGVALVDGQLPLWLRPQPGPGQAAPALALHQPLRVVAQTAERHTGTPLPVAAVSRSPNGESQVWLHERAERFRAVPVQVQPLDGARVLARGVPTGARVVTQGAGLLAQVR